MIGARFASATLVAAIVAAAGLDSSAAAGTPGTTVLVPAGTLVPVQTTESYDSFRSRSGTVVRYRVTGDVVVEGRTVARTGDLAFGHVEESRSGMVPGSGNLGRGILRVSVDAVHTFCGSTLHVASDDHADIPDAVGDVAFARGTPLVSTVTDSQAVCASPQ